MLALAVVAACSFGRSDPPPDAPESGAAPTYVGTSACVGCHADEAVAWRGSHHDLAMQVATEATVLGDFDDVRFQHGGVTARFFREGDAFRVETVGPGGEIDVYTVAYTFGVSPLQQVLLSVPGGRLQALDIAWDTRAASDGGQRWFHLSPDDTPAHGDPLHWTGRAVTWNHGCAACHVTHLDKGYDPATDRYETTWVDPDVGCEACHGAGSAHVAWASAPDRVEGTPSGVVNPLRAPAGTWAFAEGEPIAHRTLPLAGDRQLDTCAPCHARRSALTDGWTPGEPLDEAFLVRRLDEGLYFPDGQIDDEVFVHGSFLQSRMHQAGVRCTDCHDAHSLALKRPGNALCGRCHQASVFDTPDHHHHPDGPGAACVSCHMPARTYMGVDARRDHGLRVPQPHLSRDLGTPDACTGCHGDRSVGWAVEAVEAWYGSPDPARQRTARALYAGRVGAPGASELLSALAADATAPAIVRATALSGLAGASSSVSLAALRAGTLDPSAMVRRGAVDGLTGLGSSDLIALAAPLLSDPSLAVRVEVARVLAAVPDASLAPAQRRQREQADQAYKAALHVAWDHPESRTAWGVHEALRGHVEPALRAFRAALTLAPGWVPASVDLADLYRALGREDEAGAVLDAALARAPDDPGLLHAWGLQRVRVGQLEVAVPALTKAAEGAPEVARYAYVLTVALSSVGRGADASRAAEAALVRHPYDVDLLRWMVSQRLAQGRRAEALVWARRLHALAPGDPALAPVQEALRAPR